MNEISVTATDKLKSLFQGLTVKKSLASSREIAKIPRFISEYLIQRASEKAEDEKEITKKVNEFLAKYRPEHKDREWLKAKILEEGSIKILDFFDGYTDLQEGVFYVDIPILGIRKVLIPKELKDENEGLLRGGMWGLGTVGYVEARTPGFENKSEPSELAIIKFAPFQFIRCDIKYFQEARKEFSLEEWLYVLITTLGLNPEKYPSFKEKLILLTRLVPFVEDNVFLAEFGQPGTGKTFLYDKLSAYSRVISGSTETPANLFYHGTKRRPGILAVFDVVLFDEIDKVGKQKMDTEVVGKLLKFMESGVFDRMGIEVGSSASIVFGGNTREFQSPIHKLFPKEMQHKAFFDRIHSFIPGEILPRIGKSADFVAQGEGLTSDYFSEVLHRMRGISFGGLVRARTKMQKGGVRDEKAISKIVSGLIKILYPHGELTKEELQPLIDHAVEMRNRVNKEIKLMDQQADVSQVEVEVLE
jgi:ATP-dependent Lon protease